LKNSPILIILLIAALGVAPTIIAIEYIVIPALAKGCQQGFPSSASAFNASKGRCFR
jgi:hypothetical protein